VLGIFWKKTTAAGATAGLAAGLGTTMLYMIWTIDIYGNGAGLFGIPETGFGTVGMVINLVVTVVVSRFTKAPSPVMQELVEEIRYPGKTRLVAAHAEGHVEDALPPEDSDPSSRGPASR
jgi:cation/acetate symporter